MQNLESLLCAFQSIGWLFAVLPVLPAALLKSLTFFAFYCSVPALQHITLPLRCAFSAASSHCHSPTQTQRKTSGVLYLNLGFLHLNNQAVAKHYLSILED